MVNARHGSRKTAGSGRVAGGFVALPWSVLDCPAYAGLSHPARALLLEIARQFVKDNNGRLLTSAAYLMGRGWNSSDVITRAKRELLDAGFIHETVKGARPNKASWYAVTWHSLDKLQGFDPGAAATFEKGAYALRPALQNASLRPRDGVAACAVAPSDGAGAGPTTPSPGAVRRRNGHPPTPSPGNHLEKPSAVQSECASIDMAADIGEE
jgi:hypothetical protein